MALIIQNRRHFLVNTDPQRRCYWGANAQEEGRWTEWGELERLGALREGADPEERLKFWRELNDYSVSVGGARCEFRLWWRGD